MPVGRKRKQRFVCRYLAYTDEQGNSWRLPMVHIRLCHGDKSIRTAGLIDSGATCTFVPSELADILDVPAGDLEEALGAGGKFSVRPGNITIEVLKGFSVFHEFVDYNVLIPESEQSIPYAVLGRDSVFRDFKVEFRERDEHVILKSY